MDILKQLKNQADQVEVVDLRSETTTIGFEANKLKSSQVEKTKGVAVRVVKDGRLGFAASSATLDTEPALEKVMTNVLESAEYGDEVPIFFPPSQRGPKVTTFDPTIKELSVPRMAEIGQEIIDLFLQIEPEARVNIDMERGVHAGRIRVY